MCVDINMNVMQKEDTDISDTFQKKKKSTQKQDKIFSSEQVMFAVAMKMYGI